MLFDAGGTSLEHCVVVAWFPRELFDAVMCCTQYIRVSEPGNSNSAQCLDTSNILTNLRLRTEVDAAFEKVLDPIAGSPALGKIRGRNNQSLC